MFRLADPSKVVFGGIITIWMIRPPHPGQAPLPALLLNGRMNGSGTAGR